MTWYLKRSWMKWAFDEVLDTSQETSQEEAIEEQLQQEESEFSESFQTQEESESGDSFQSQEEGLPTSEPEPETVEQTAEEKSVTGDYQKIESVVNETVIVEPSTAVRLDYALKKAKIIPYSERRLKWGRFIGVSVGKASLDDFSSDYLNDTFESIYGDDSSLGLELHMNFKRNFSFYSLGVESKLRKF